MAHGCRTFEYFQQLSGNEVETTVNDSPGPKAESVYQFFFFSQKLIKILISNVPDVYTAWDIMILMRAIPLQGPLERAGPENQDFCALI
jgi:hypothetical protein